MTSHNQRLHAGDQVSSDVLRNAPFGSYFTPDITTKIVGSKYRNYQVEPLPVSPSTPTSTSSPQHNVVINPRPVLPPIYQDPPQSIQLSQLTDMYLPPSNLSQLTYKPIQLRPMEQYSLVYLLQEQLHNFSDVISIIKQIYLSLAHIDVNLTGLCTFTELVHAFYSNKLAIKLDLLRLIGSLYVVPSRDTVPYLNYEKVVSFIGAVHKNAIFNTTTRSRQSEVLSPREKQTDRPIYYHTSECLDQRSHEGPKPPLQQVCQNKGGQKSSLLEQMSQELSGVPLPIYQLRMACQRSDSLHRGTLSARQLHAICHSPLIDVPLSEETFQRAILHCRYMGGGQINWEDFIMLLEKVQPIVTGLQIPSSRMPNDYIRPMPAPNNSWPHCEPLELHLGPDTARPTEPRKPINSGDTAPERKEFSQQYSNVDEDPVARETRDIIAQNNMAQTVKQPETTVPASGFSEPWFNRFLKFCDEIYFLDKLNQGVLPTETIYQSSLLFNHRLQLQMPSSRLSGAIDSSHVDNDRRYVNINQYLRHLASAQH